MFYAKIVAKCLTLRCVGDGVVPTAAFPMELGNTPEPVEEAPTSAWEEQTVNEERLSEYGEQKNAPKAADPAAQNDAAEIYVSSTGNDEQNTGTKDLPFATLAKAVDAAADGTTIYVMSDLTMDQCARFTIRVLKSPVEKAVLTLLHAALILSSKVTQPAAGIIPP